MTTAEIIFVSMTAAFAVINFALNGMQSVLIDRYKALLKDYYDKLDEAYTKDDEVLKYCLVQILKKAIDKNIPIYLPIDHVVAKEFKEDAESMEVLRASIDSGWQGMDIGPNTIEKFRSVILKAKTIFWNGPMGVFEFDKFAKGTLE